jgi:hypothetical protein
VQAVRLELTQNRVLGPGNDAGRIEVVDPQQPAAIQ